MFGVFVGICWDLDAGEPSSLILDAGEGTLLEDSGRVLALFESFQVLLTCQVSIAGVLFCLLFEVGFPGLSVGPFLHLCLNEFRQSLAVASL